MILKKFFIYRIFLLLISLLIFFLDLKSKIWIQENIYLYQTVYVTNFLNFFYSKNYGIAFSLFSNEKNFSMQYFLIIVSIVAIILLFIKIYYIHYSSYKLFQIGYALIIGGALGNTYDRFCHGFVIDFIDLHINKWHFAIFNVADFSIFIGILLVFLIKIFIKK